MNGNYRAQQQQKQQQHTRATTVVDIDSMKEYSRNKFRQEHPLPPDATPKYMQKPTNPAPANTSANKKSSAQIMQQRDMYRLYKHSVNCKGCPLCTGKDAEEIYEFERELLSSERPTYTITTRDGYDIEYDYDGVDEDDFDAPTHAYVEFEKRKAQNAKYDAREKHRFNQYVGHDPNA